MKVTVGSLRVSQIGYDEILEIEKSDTAPTVIDRYPHDEDEKEEFSFLRNMDPQK